MLQQGVSFWMNVFCSFFSLDTTLCHTEGEWSSSCERFFLKPFKWWHYSEISRDKSWQGRKSTLTNNQYNSLPGLLHGYFRSYTFGLLKAFMNQRSYSLQEWRAGCIHTQKPVNLALVSWAVVSPAVSKVLLRLIPLINSRLF